MYGPDSEMSVTLAGCIGFVVGEFNSLLGMHPIEIGEFNSQICDGASLKVELGYGNCTLTGIALSVVVPSPSWP